VSSRIGIAKSEHVAHTLEQEIRAGRFGHGDQLDSEGGLMRRFSVSRNTVRRGLEILTRQGLITTRVGIGSFVTCDGTTIDSNLGWSVALSHGTGAVTTRILSLWRGACPQADQRFGKTFDYLCIDRLRVCEAIGWGISLERSRLPWCDAFDAVLESGLSGGSLNRTLGELGLAATSGQELASVIPALSESDAALMGRPSGAPMLRLDRITRRTDGTPHEYVESILDPARFGLRIDF